MQGDVTCIVSCCSIVTEIERIRNRAVKATDKLGLGDGDIDKMRQGHTYTDEKEAGAGAVPWSAQFIFADPVSDEGDEDVEFDEDV